MDAIPYWLALNRIKGLGPAHQSRLLERFSDPIEVFRNPGDAAAGLPAAIGRQLRKPPWREVEQDLNWLDKPGHHLMVRGDTLYPPLLREIAGPPLLLFARGRTELAATPQLAVVGSRNPTPGGVANTRIFAMNLALQGLTITSGLAMGIDSWAHRGALEAGGGTVAVLGCGLDKPYPRRNCSLADEIVTKGGMLLSEFPPGTPPLKDHFPRRNRIISGLSLGVLVVEAAVRSGSLITARLAAEQGREVFAVPGAISNPLARGCHRLLRDGARLVEHSEDILEELAWLSPIPVTHQADESLAAPADDAGELLAHLGFEPMTVDELVSHSGLTPDAVCSMLLVLELQGYVQSLAGGCYARK